MEPEARYTLVGTSVLILLALVTAAVLWLVATGQGKDVQTYKIYFAKQSLEGLQIRSDVRMRGIRVGAVTRISFSARRRGAVEVEVGVDPTTPVRESTRAVVDRNLITGLATIRLLNVTEDSPPLKEAPPGEDEAVIAEGASQLQQFSETVNHLAQHADETLLRINDTLSAQNQAAFAETLDQLRMLTKSTNHAVTRLDGTLASIGGAADAVRTSTGVMSGEVQRLANRYDGLGAQTEVSIRELAGNMRQMSEGVARLSTRTDALLANSDFELRLTGQQLRSAADAMGATARKLGDPRAALFGPAEASLGPGEERR
jgi:phospholipid/cholesterol/gamma-HCH transport system substrate-binding protein